MLSVGFAGPVFAAAARACYLLGGLVLVAGLPTVAVLEGMLGDARASEAARIIQKQGGTGQSGADWMYISGIKAGLPIGQN